MVKTNLLIFAGFVLLMSILMVSILGYNVIGDSEMIEKEIYPEVVEKAYFAGGCFWCTEADFEKVYGVIEVISGYAGGQKENPTYKEVSSGITSYTETIEIIYDPSKVNYERLLEVFWRVHDPTDSEGQFVDRGKQYRPAIFYLDENEKISAEQSLEDLKSLNVFDEPVITEIVPLTKFYPAEEYHQDYYKKSPTRYNFYRSRSGRDLFLDGVWGEDRKIDLFGEKYSKLNDEELKKKLTPLQYDVTQNDDTEKPYENEYWDNKEDGIYVDIVSGEPLFSSKDKYDSKTGWPSFTQPLEPDNIVRKKDFKLVYPRTELRSKYGDSHLGHVFKDGPKDKGGLRYCINSAAMRFVPKDKLVEEGYGKYLKSFE